ncbi:uncharacterized protein LOC121272174 isoform X2 [Carcharodon carcharias]|uniref:uncharacterized protein LOC121272174 isoform X2 n=1 Tax=Carcharodon carcharias TaxID=13397 RepID=UPI001B7E023D|nr:uncharacterized protein LOC121272174 isoform X2 [Carcharodon carcharias]
MEDGEMGMNRVQDVCQTFQILEDQKVAHVLQEEEIQQHFSANKLKSQQVRQNLQVARRLQGEEDEKRRQLTQRLRKHIKDVGSDYARTIQEEQDREEDNSRQRRRYKEASSRLRWFAREVGEHHDVEQRTDCVMGQGDEVSPDPWDLPSRQESPHYGQPRSRQPFILSGPEEGAGWDERQRDGKHRRRNAGTEPGAAEAVHNRAARGLVIKHPPTERLGISPSPVHGVPRGKRAVGVKQTPTEGSPRTFPTGSKPQLERPRPWPEGRQNAGGGKERDGQRRRDCPSDWSYTEDSERPSSKPTITGGNPPGCQVEGPDRSRFSPGSRSGLVDGEGLDVTRRSTSDSESHSRRRKRQRDPGELRLRARSEVSHWVGQNGEGPARPKPQRGNGQEAIRRKPRGQGDPRPTADPQGDRHSRLDVERRANHLHHPLDPTERLKQEERPDEERGHHPLAVKEKKQTHHPLVVGEKQARQLLAVNQTHATRSLVGSERPTHYPLRTKAKVKQVHFLLDPEEKMKPAHWSETSKQKQVQHPLELKEKEVRSPMLGRQKHVHSPLAVEGKGRQVQIPLAVRGKDVQSPLAGKRNAIQYRLGAKDTDTIIDYLQDKRKGKDSSPPKHLSKPSLNFKGSSPDTDRGKPVKASSSSRKLLPSLPAGDIREDGTLPPHLLAEKDSIRNPSSDRPKASPAHSGSSCWRDEPSLRATNGQENVLLLFGKEVNHRNLRSSQWKEPNWVRAHEDRIKDRSGRSKADHSQTPSPLNWQENRLHEGEQGVSETGKKFASEKSRNLRNGVSSHSWCSDEVLKDLQAMELRKARHQKAKRDERLAQIVQDEKARHQKAKRDERLAQIVQDEEFALHLLRKEMTALRMSEGQKQPESSQKRVDRKNEKSLRSCSPCSVSVDWDEEVKMPKPAYF